MKSYVALLSITLLSLTFLMTPIPVIQASPIDKFWALSIAAGYEYDLDPHYLKRTLENQYPFSGVTYLAGVHDKDDVRNAIRAIPSDGNDLVFIFIFSHGGGYNTRAHQLYGPTEAIDGSRGDPKDEGNEFRETDVDIDFDRDGKLESDVWGGIDESMKIMMYEGAPVEFYWDDEVKEDLKSLNYEILIFFYQGCKLLNETEGEGCFSGGFIRDLSAPNRIIITPCNETDFSYAEPDDSPFEEYCGCFSRPFISALDKEDPAFNEADTGRDGEVSVGEAFRYAWKNDKARIKGMETPKLDDNGDGVANEKDGILAYRTVFKAGLDTKKGGEIVPIDIVGLIFPYIALTLMVSVGFAAINRKLRKRNQG